MCEFCKPDELGNGKEITKQLAVEPIDMGMMNNVLQLEAWLLSDESGNHTKIQLLLCTDEATGEIANIEIPITYCPKCGRKLN